MTLARKMLSCVEEYELIKQGKSNLFSTVKEFCSYNRFSRQNFLKIYRRYQQEATLTALLPQKRGPRYKTRRTDINIEKKITELRQKGNNRYEIHEILKNELKDFTPSPSCIYNICKRYGLNKLRKQHKQERRKIIMQRAGELAHIDCHYLSKGITIKDYPKLYLVAVMDGYSRIAWAEIIEDIKSLTVMFSVLRCFNMIKSRYNIQFECVITDNGAEFGSGKDVNNKMDHPFERMLYEMGIKHKYTKPYRPQTNGKVERFWKTLNEDMLEDACYEDIEDFRKELLEYLIYYNEHRPHQGLDNKIPIDFIPKS
jgi:ribosomal protein L20A (L18A)